MIEDFQSEVKLKRLIELLRKLAPVAIAVSGGKDSLFLLLAAKNALPAEEILVVYVQTPLAHPLNEERLQFISKFSGMTIERLKADLLRQKTIKSNRYQRCYFCKKIIFQKIINFVHRRGIRNILDGSTVSDIDLFRPGLKALQELQIISPLVEAQINETEIVNFLKKYIPREFLTTTTCLATRFPYNHQLKKSELSKISSLELFLHQSGIYNFRVRHISDGIRIEADPEQWPTIFSLRSKLLELCNQLGFKFTTLDLQGLRRGCWD